MRGGALERVLSAAQEKRAVDQGRQAERESAWAAGICAEILEARGELEEALKIWRDEQLPVYERLGDVGSWAVAMGRVSDILEARGKLEEALRIRRDEELPVYERLGDVRSLLVCRANLALLYLRRSQPGDREVAASLLRLARTSAESLRHPDVAQIMAIQRQWGL